MAILAGTAAGLAANALGGGAPWLEWTLVHLAQPVGQIFLRLLFMLVIPLIFAALALGVAGLGDLRSLGRIGLKTLVYTVAVSAVAVLIGITLVNLFRPGEGMSDETRARLVAGAARRASSLATAETATV